MNCVDCGVPLKGSAIKKYCPQCGHVYRVERGSGQQERVFQKTDELYFEELRIQEEGEGVTINPCFKNLVKPFDRPSRLAPPIRRFSEEPSTHNFAGFEAGTPLLHFIWLGVPESHLVLETPFQWAPLLAQGWGGVCLWLEPDCLNKFATIWGVEKTTEALPTLTEDRIQPLARTIRGGVPIYFAAIDDHLEGLSKKYDEQLGQNVRTLHEAINFERVPNQAPLRLPQVASDIARVLILRFYGGVYFDFDVAPSPRCRSTGLCPPSLIPLGPSGFLCHRKLSINENDILFADPRRPPDTLNGLIRDMVKFYRKPSSRHDLLMSLLESHFPEHVDAVLETYRKGMRPDSQLLLKLARIVESDALHGRKKLYLQILQEQMEKLVDLVSETVQQATFSGFQFYVVAEDNDRQWRHMECFFSYETLTKPFYSWKDPGSSAALKLIEGAITVQAAVRAFLARKRLGELQQPQSVQEMQVDVPVPSPSIVVDAPQPQPRIVAPRMRRLELCGPMTAYAGAESYYIMEGVLEENGEVDQESYVGVTLIDVRARVFFSNGPSKERSLKNVRVFVHRDGLRRPFVREV